MIQEQGNLAVQWPSVNVGVELSNVKLLKTPLLLLVVLLLRLSPCGLLQDILGSVEVLDGSEIKKIFLKIE